MDALRDFLYMVDVDGSNRMKNTCLITDIKWDEKELAIETLVATEYDIISVLKFARTITVSFLTSTGDVAHFEKYKVKLKSHHPMGVGHSKMEFLKYKFVYSY